MGLAAEKSERPDTDRVRKLVVKRCRGYQVIGS